MYHHDAHQKKKCFVTDGGGIYKKTRVVPCKTQILPTKWVTTRTYCIRS